MQLWIVVVGCVVLVGCQELQQPSQPRLPDSAALYKTVFTPPEQCQPCHPDHYREWAMSMHAYAVVDPLFHAMNEQGQVLTGGRLGQFCIRCHSPAASLLGETPTGMVTKPLSAHARGGVTCVTCHAAVEQVPGHGIQQFRFDGILAATIPNPITNNFHRSAFDSTFAQSENCAGCHDVVNQRGFRVEQTYTEWLGSVFPGRNLTCQACHMPALRGPAAVGGPPRMRHRHIMEGVDVPLTDFPGRDETMQLIQYVLENALIVTLQVPTAASRTQPLPIECTLFNQNVGHNIPSGTIFERQLWIELVVTNEHGDTVYASGLLDPNGDLRTNGSEYVARGLLPRDTALALFNGTAFRHGQPIDFFFDADAVINRTIPPFEQRTARYSIPAFALSSSFHLEIRCRVLFRPLPPFLLRKMGLGDLVERLPIFTMKTITTTVTLQP